jgi:hypothetical protein
MRKFIWPVLLIALGIGLLQEDIRDRRNDKAFREHGETAVLDPIKEYIQTTYSKRGKVTGATMTADLVYTTKTGDKVVVPSITLTPLAATQAQQGVPIQIQYLPERPQTIRLPGAAAYDESQRMIIYAILFGGLLWFFGAWKSGSKPTAAD